LKKNWNEFKEAEKRKARQKEKQKSAKLGMMVHFSRKEHKERNLAAKTVGG